MVRALVILAVIVGGLAVLFFGSFAISPSSEVVTLVTKDEDGNVHETPLWVVDVEGVQWLRAGNPDADWVDQLRENPRVELVRNDELRSYEVEFVVDDPTREHINEMMREKYGASDAMVGLFYPGPDESLPIRLNVRRVASPPPR